MLKNDLENLFSSCHKVHFRKKTYLAIFCIIFQKNDKISDVIIPIAAMLKTFAYFLQHYKVWLCQISCQKHFHIRIYVSPSLGMIRQNYPREDSVNVEDYQSRTPWFDELRVFRYTVTCNRQHNKHNTNLLNG